MAGCEPEEAARVRVDVLVDGEAAALPVTTDLGYEVRLTSARVVIEDPVFTTGGETHGDRGLLPLMGAALRSGWSALVPDAMAHPGHYAGGEIIGELTGRFVFDWVADDGMVLGTADLLEGSYEGVNFGLSHGEAVDGLDEGDPLLGSSALFEGEVSRDGETRTFSALIVQDADVAVIGGIFQYELRDGQDLTLHLAFLPSPDTTDATPYDGIEFFADENASATEGHVELLPESPDDNRLRKALQSHDFYAVTVTEE